MKTTTKLATTPPIIAPIGVFGYDFCRFGMVEGVAGGGGKDAGVELEEKVEAMEGAVLEGAVIMGAVVKGGVEVLVLLVGDEDADERMGAGGS